MRHLDMEVFAPRFGMGMECITEVGTTLTGRIESKPSMMPLLLRPKEHKSLLGMGMNLLPNYHVQEASLLNSDFADMELRIMANLNHTTIVKYKKNRETVIVSPVQAVRRDRTFAVITPPNVYGLADRRDWLYAGG